MSANNASVDSLLGQISDSLKSTSGSLDNLISFIDESNDHPDLVRSLLKESGMGQNESLEGVSLLSLKNSALLAYLNNLLLILGSKVVSMTTDKESVLEQTASVKESAVKNTIIQRVTLDRGVKSLEKKLNYQLDKLIGAYQRREKEQNEVDLKSQKAAAAANDDEDEDDEDEDSEEEDDGLNYRPDASAFLKSAGPGLKASTKREQKHSDNDDDEEEETEETSNEKYRPPKIAAVLPPQQFSENDSSHQKRQRNLQSMDEYLQDISEAPALETSIGSTILNKGRDLKTQKQLEKEAEITKYEEENFTRLPATQLKMSAKEKKKKQKNEFFGEDWSMFDNSREFTDSNAKKRKRLSAWERAKRRRD